MPLQAPVRTSTRASEGLTERQRREVEYHRRHAVRFARSTPVAFDIIDPVRRRWWNAYWHAYTRLLETEPAGKRVLVVGCGFGDDAVRLAALGARVSAFDLSADSLAIAARRAAEAGVPAIDFRELPCEALDYPDDSFDVVFGVDILHHVDIAATLSELVRVAAPGCRVVLNEPCTHRYLTRLRRSRAVERWVYPRLARWLHSVESLRDLYVTQDERKLDDGDLRLLVRHVRDLRLEYFNAVTGRLLPERLDRVARVDRTCLRVLGERGALLAGRVVATGRLRA